MAKVPENIRMSLKEHPRGDFIAYSHGTPEMAKFVESSSFLRKVGLTYQYFIYQNRA